MYFIVLQVKFVDSGRVDDIPAHKLYELPSHLKEIPFQVIFYETLKIFTSTFQNEISAKPLGSRRYEH